MSLLEDKALRVNLITMVILVITAIYDFIFRGGEKLFRIGLMAVTLWIVYFVYKKTFLRKMVWKLLLCSSHKNLNNLII